VRDGEPVVRANVVARIASAAWRAFLTVNASENYLTDTPLFKIARLKSGRFRNRPATVVLMADRSAFVHTVFSARDTRATVLGPAGGDSYRSADWRRRPANAIRNDRTSCFSNSCRYHARRLDSTILPCSPGCAIRTTGRLTIERSVSSTGGTRGEPQVRHRSRLQAGRHTPIIGLPGTGPRSGPSQSNTGFARAFVCRHAQGG
jgi:hypothetical protein